MKRSAISIMTALLLMVASEGVILAQTVPWTNHSPPFTFLFGNEIDTHQQSRLLPNGNLQGFLYIQYTGETIDGIPVAVHGPGVVGWVITGVPVEATLISLDPLTWCVDPSLIPKSPGYTFFHPIGSNEFVVGQNYEGYLLKLTARATFYFRHEENGNLVLVTPGVDYASHQNIMVGCP